MDQPRIFVSHSHQDDRFTKRLVNDLTRAGADVWVDTERINHGNFMQRIDEALGQCEWVVLVLTPNAIASQSVMTEVFAALPRVQHGHMRGVIPILAAPCEPGTIPPLIDVLQRYDATRRYKSALAEVLRMVGLSLSGVDDLLTRAEVLLDNEQYADALPLLERATRLAPDNLGAWFDLAFAHLMADQWEDVLAATERALSIKPDYSFTWNLKGTALAYLGRYEEALAAVECSIALDPNRSADSSTWNLKGNLLNDLKQYEEALVAFDRALVLDPQFAPAWDGKGNALRGLKRHEEAVVAYDEALALDPNIAGAKRHKGNSLRALARKAQAQEAEQRAQELGA